MRQRLNRPIISHFRAGIMQYSSLGKVFLMGDFNAKMQNRQCDTYDLGRASNNAFNILGGLTNM